MGVSGHEMLWCLLGEEVRGRGRGGEGRSKELAERA